MTTPDKRFSQNFLIHPATIDMLIRLIRPALTDDVVEIGPGEGALTRILSRSVRALRAVEIDRRLLSVLRDMSLPNTEYILGDILQQDWHSLLQSTNNTRMRLIGNLPYHISSEILQKCAAHSDVLRDVHFMLQKEVAERLIACSGKTYGRLSLLIQKHFSVQLLHILPSDVFYPAPRVQSAFVRLTPHTSTHKQLFSDKTLSCISGHAFQQRRKKIRNSLQALFSVEELTALSISPNARAEDIPPEQFFMLCQYYEQRDKSAHNKHEKTPLLGHTN